MGHLTKLIKEKKTSMHFGSLFMSFGWIIDITNKVLSLVSLAVFIVFNNLFGWWIVFNGHVNDRWKVVRLVIQKSCLSDQVRVINSIFTRDTSLLAANPYLLISDISNLLLGQASSQCYLKTSCISLELKLLLSIHLKNTTFHLSIKVYPF